MSTTIIMVVPMVHVTRSRGSVHASTSSQTTRMFHSTPVRKFRPDFRAAALTKIVDTLCGICRRLARVVWGCTRIRGIVPLSG